MNIIFIAPPAAGKGTISQYLVDNFGYTHLSTGDLLRKIVKSGSELGNKVANLINEGKFISDDIMLELIENELNPLKDTPFILDGIPRNIHQAESLENLMKKLNVDNYVVINLEVKKDILEKRVVGRKVCSSCGASYNIYFEKFKPIKENICNQCNSELINREDDSLETFNNRYNTYIKETFPLIDFYKKRNRLRNIVASGMEEDIIFDVISVLKGDKND